MVVIRIFDPVNEPLLEGFRRPIALRKISSHAGGIGIFFPTNTLY